MKFSLFRMGFGAIFLLALSFPVFAADDKAAETQKEILMREVSIIGSKYNVKDIAGSAAYLDVQDIREHGVEDINRVLRRVPGVNLREEDGYGLFPNISLRGVDPARSSKVTIMEDGVLMAPAPYSAPSAYYIPNTGRMSGIEVLKGSSQIKYGPHSTGGAINFLSTPIPTTSQVYQKSSFGMYNELRSHSYFGNTEQLAGGGRFGYVIEYYTRGTTGFKELDALADNDTTGPPGLRGEANTGFDRQEPMLKVFWEPKTNLYQRIEAKFGFSNLDANETYSGLNSADFDSNPYRRYAVSRFDEIESTQFRTYVRHLIELNNATSLVTTVYGNTFNRNWQKLDKINNTSQSVVFAAPNSANYTIATGYGDGNDFTVKSNNRTYYMYGVQFDLKHKKTIGKINHEFELNVRHHYDQIRRKQWQETYTTGANGGITAVSASRRGSKDNRKQATWATAVNLSDKMKSGKWTFTPGVRTETLKQEYCDDDTNCANETVEGSRTYTVIVGGGSLKFDAYDIDGRDLDFFTGMHRGFSPAGPRSNIKSGVKHETSIGIEIGTRYKNAKKAFAGELVLFHTSFDNLVVPASIGGVGGSSTDGENLGEVRSMGIELSASYDPGLANNWSYQMPMYFAATGTNAEFVGDDTAGSTEEETIFAGSRDGNNVPYIAPFQVSFGVGWIYDKYSLSFDANYQSEMYADGSNTCSNGNANTGTPNERFGCIEDRLVVDASAGYQWSDKVRTFATAKNIFNEEYMVSRQPHGPRPGLPFTLMAGLEFNL
ncbi:MAG: TonB-dependent receptor plug domain-containing protein [Nitrospinota bacterium]|nr:TonB-dependent receptor plug domain-containing protein [Nitrospinota bacterium]